MEQTVNPRVWTDRKTVGQAQNAVPVFIKLNDCHLFSHQKQYPLKLEVNEWAKSYCNNFFDVSGILKSKVQSNNAPLLKLL